MCSLLLLLLVVGLAESGNELTKILSTAANRLQCNQTASTINDWSFDDPYILLFMISFTFDIIGMLLRRWLPWCRQRITFGSCCQFRHYHDIHQQPDSIVASSPHR
jgi:hypothetical protein